MLFRIAWLLLCVLPLVALCAEDYYKVNTNAILYTVVEPMLTWLCIAAWY